MTLGQKIKKLRTDVGLTQKDLADKVFVTFQTVSKWENDENEPDVPTLRELARIFDCSLDYLLSEDDGSKPVSEVKQEVIEAPVEPVTKTIIIHQKELHVCRKCQKDIPEDDLAVEYLKKTERHGRVHRTVSAGEAYYHKECWKKEQEERAAAATLARAMNASKAKKMSFGWGIAGGVVTLGIFLAVFLCNTQYINVGLGIGLSILFGYAIFADIYCILSGSYIGGVFVTVASWTIKFPGLIFSWDLSGFVWLIGMKILFAVLGFLLTVGLFLLAVGLSAALAVVSFPFVLIHNIRTQYSDSLL